MASRRTPIALGVLAAAALTGGAAYAVTATAHSSHLTPSAARTVSDVSRDSARTVYLEADLNGRNEQTSGMSPMGSPMATATEVLRIRGNQVAYWLSWHNLGTPTVAHVRQGTSGHTGSVAMTELSAPLPGSVTAVAGIVTVSDGRVLSRMVGDPGAFYVNMGTATFPGGAVRGQFHTVGPVDLDRILHVGPFAAVGSGDQEVSTGAGTGNQNVRTTAFLGLGANTISYAISWSGVNSPTSASLNRGGVGANGAAIATLFTAHGGLPASVTAVGGTVSGVSANTITAIRANPPLFHTNLFTRGLPGGAARGQLFTVAPMAPTTAPTMPTSTPPVTMTQPTTMPTRPTTTMPTKPMPTTTMPMMPTTGTTTPGINTPAPPHW
jgi:hypothetical protein